MVYVVTGVTGKTGSAVAETLLAAGKNVRVVVRDAAKGESWKARGAEVAVADLNDGAAYAKALAGAEGAYVMFPPDGFTDPDPAPRKLAMVDTVANALAVAKVPHVVLLSSVGAHHASGTGPIVALHAAEQKLRALGTPVTFLRAAYFMENLGSQIGQATAAGALYTQIEPTVRFGMVATEDIGKKAAELLLAGAPDGVRVVELAGPADRTMNDVAAVLSAVAGKTVSAVKIPREAFLGAMTGMGASPKFAEGFAELNDGVNAGRIVPESATIARGTTTLESKVRALANG